MQIHQIDPQKRNLTNKLLSSLCWSLIVGLVLIVSSDLYVYAVGPLPAPVCFFQTVYKHVARDHYYKILNRFLKRNSVILKRCILSHVCIPNDKAF
jgi:hypothetical protein